MDSQSWQQVKPLLNAALEKPAAERCQFLASACAGNPELLKQVLDMLEAGETKSNLPNGHAEIPVYTPPDVAFIPGQLLLDRFRIVRLIGRGGMGEVYEAEDLELGRVALKTIRLRSLNQSQMLRQFLQEVQLARKVSGPNVCRIHELFTLPEHASHAPAAFLTMEYLEGVTLADRLHQGPLPPKDAQRIALDLCAGLAAIHAAGVIHRDLKSRNVMLVQRRGRVETQECAVLMDFGLALPVDEGDSLQGLSQTSLHAGTPEYMAPEQFEDGALTPAADIYALGILLYELVTARQPFPAHTPLAAAVRRARRPELRRAPRGWREIIFRCLELDPAKRYQSADEVAAALRRAASPVALATHHTANFAWRFRTAFAVLIVAAVAIAALYFHHRATLHKPPADAVTWYNLGVNALRESTYVKATRELKKAIDRDPKFAMAHARLAEAWSELDFTREAQHEMLLAGTLSQQQLLSDEDKKYLAATNATLLLDYPAATQRYQSMLDNESDKSRKPDDFVDLGRSLEKSGHPDQALADYQRAAALAPDNPAPFVHIGILEGRAQHTAAAHEAFEKAESIYRDEQNMEGLAEIEYQRGYLANVMGEPAAARKHLDTALAQANAIDSIQLQIRILTQLSSVASDARDQTEALKFAHDAINLAQAHDLETWAADGYARLGNSYIKSGDPAMQPKAEAALLQALEISRQSEQRRVEADANLAMASIRSNQGRRDEAIVFRQRALDYDKANNYHEGITGSEILQARDERDLDKFPQAMQTSWDLLNESQRNGNKVQFMYAQDLMGSILLREEQYPAALQAYTAALNSSAEAMRPYEAVGCAEVLSRLGRYDEAESMLRADVKPNNVDAERTEIEVALDHQQYAPALALSNSALAQPGNQSNEDLLIAKSIAEAKLGKVDAAEKDIQAAKSTSLPKKLAAWELADAKVELAAKHPDQAKKSALAALTYYQTIGAHDSALQAAALAAQACRALNQPAEFTANAKIGLDNLNQLQHSWSPEDYKSYTSRPEIRNAQLYLTQDKSPR